MSGANVKLVRGVYEAVARGKIESVLAAYDPAIVQDFTRSPVSVVIRAVYEGHEGLRDANREWYELWETIDYELKELLDAGDQVVSVVTVRATGRASGAEAEMALNGVWTIKGGKITRVDWLASREDALEAAGLSK